MKSSGDTCFLKESYLTIYIHAVPCNLPNELLVEDYMAWYNNYAKK